MSYDYMLGKGDATNGVEGFMDGVYNQSIGTVEELQAAIASLYPALRWDPPAANVPGNAFGREIQVWFSRGGFPQIRLMAEADGQVHILSMSRCERSEVEHVARALQLIAFDEQTMEVFGG